MTEPLELHANGLSFSAITSGPADGDVVVLLHGFPDSAATFEAQVEALAGAGFRCIAPTMRGYEPSSQPADGDHSLMTLASDVIGWLDELDVERAHVVGHDWGAVVVYVLASHHPDRLLTATTLAIPPLARIPAAVRRVPKQLMLSWYMTFFQLRWVADKSLAARNWALVRRLWKRWSPSYELGAAESDALLAVFERPGVVGSALAYYRQNATPSLLLGLRTTPAMEVAPSGVPMLIVHGDEDGCMDRRLFDHCIVEADHPAGLQHQVVPGTGHFLHLEAPDRVNALLLDWLTQR